MDHKSGWDKSPKKWAYVSNDVLLIKGMHILYGIIPRKRKSLVFFFQFIIIIFHM